MLMKIINTHLEVIFLPLWSKMEQTIKQWQEKKHKKIKKHKGILNAS